jgi:hypothetical protein
MHKGLQSGRITRFVVKNNPADDLDYREYNSKGVGHNNRDSAVVDTVDEPAGGAHQSNRRTQNRDEIIISAFENFHL